MSSVTLWLFSSILSSLHVFIAIFSFWLICSLIVLWLEKMLDMVSVFLNLLRAVLWPSMLSILETVQCALEKNILLLLEKKYSLCNLLSPFGLKCHLRPMLPYWFSVWMICPLVLVGLHKVISRWTDDPCRCSGLYYRTRTLSLGNINSYNGQ